jgi:CDP-diglyceride synthetase
MTATALGLSMLLLAFLLFHQVEQIDTRPAVPVARKTEKQKTQAEQSPDPPSAGASSSSTAVAAGAPVGRHLSADLTHPTPSLLLQANSPLASAHEFLSVIVLIFGLWYTGFLFAHGILVLQHPSGMLHSADSSSGSGSDSGAGVARVLYVIVVTAGGENGGMFFGRGWGRLKFTPRISPNKSREGAWAQLVTSMLVAALFAHMVPSIDLSTSEALLSGLLIGVAATLGDLFESFLKRSVGVKDLGSIIPGAGGMADRMDGILFSFPTFYYFLQFAHVASAGYGAAASAAGGMS